MADMFLKLTDISGESMDIDHEDEIEVFDWRWGLDNDASFALRDQGQATPHTTVAHLSIDKVLDNATVPLVQYCAHGKHISEAVLVCRKNTGAKYGEKHTPQGHVDEYWKIELRDVKVLTVKWPGKAPEGHVIETVDFSFLHFNISYKVESCKGALHGARHFPFSIPEQKVVTK
jgi:type VI secretion system secreted protein Hcp